MTSHGFDGSIAAIRTTGRVHNQGQLWQRKNCVEWNMWSNANGPWLDVPKSLSLNGPCIEPQQIPVEVSKLPDTD